MQGVIELINNGNFQSMFLAVWVLAFIAVWR